MTPLGCLRDVVIFFREEDDDLREEEDEEDLLLVRDFGIYIIINIFLFVSLVSGILLRFSLLREKVDFAQLFLKVTRQPYSTNAYKGYRGKLAVSCHPNANC